MDVKKEVGIGLTDEELMNMTGGASFISSDETAVSSTATIMYGIMPEYGIAPPYGIMPKYGIKTPVTIKYGVKPWVPGISVKYGARTLYGVSPRLD